jgi:general secretion pathway protein A
MYLNFYGLSKQPFHITPDPEFLYLSPSHKEALGAIIYGIEQKKGFVTVTGAVGVGKTTILRSYLDTAERDHLKIIYIFNSRLTFDALLKTIYRELGLPFESDNVVEMVNRLYEVLIEEYRAGNTVVLVIDEAQNMPVDTLESVRMISNLETSQDKLIQIVLVGQPEFEDELNLERLRQLRQRIAIRSTILPLTEAESLEYIRFRLLKAGANPNTAFDGRSVRAIARKAQGIPRVINILCDNALVTAFGYQRKPVSRKIVKEVIRDLEGSTSHFFSVKRLAAAALALVLASVGIFWIFQDRWLPFAKIWALTPVEQKGPDRPADQTEARPRPVPAASEGTQPAAVEQGDAVAADRSPAAVKETQTAAAEEPRHPKKTPDRAPTVSKVAVRGTSLSKMAQQIYGTSNAEIIESIRKHNPQIVDPDIIIEGATIVFPHPASYEKAPGTKDLQSKTDTISKMKEAQ